MAVPSRNNSGNQRKPRESGFPSLDEPLPPQSPFADFGINAGAVEEIHETFQVDPSSVDESWVEAFGYSQPANGLGPAPSPQRNSVADSAEPQKVDAKKVQRSFEPRNSTSGSSAC